MKKEELSWVLGGLEEGSETADEKKKKNKQTNEGRKKMVNRKSSLKDSSSTWIF